MKDKTNTLTLNREDKQKMALAPSKIMTWQFTRELVDKRMNRDSYSKWKANEEAANRRAKEMRQR